MMAIPNTKIIRYMSMPISSDKANPTRKNTVPIFEKWPKEKAKELYIRAKKPKRRSKYSYALILIILRKRGTMKLTMNNNTMGTINPCTNNIQLPA